MTDRRRAGPRDLSAIGSARWRSLVTVRGVEVALVAGITMFISVVATLFPALKASSLRPVEGLRYD